MAAYDFAGWATKNDIKCSDGRTIRRDAFKDDDGKKVPLVFAHNHDDPEMVLGHAVLRNKKDGVWAECFFNNTDKAKVTKELIKHGDVGSLSIYANKLKQSPEKDVLHGSIKEVSVVLAGANPGATIEFPMIAHGDGEYDWAEDEAIIECHIEGLDLSHSDISENEEEEIVEHADSEKKNEEEKDVADSENKQETAPVAEEKGDSNGKTIGEIMDTLTKEQKDAVEVVLAVALEDALKEQNGETNNKEENDVTVSIEGSY